MAGAAACRLTTGVNSAVANMAEARVIKIEDRMLKECIKLALKGGGRLKKIERVW